MDMAIGNDTEGGDLLEPLDRVKLSSVDIGGRPALPRPLVGILISMVDAGQVRGPVEGAVTMLAENAC